MEVCVKVFTSHPGTRQLLVDKNIPSKVLQPPGTGSMTFVGAPFCSDPLLCVGAPPDTDPKHIWKPPWFRSPDMC